MNRIIEGHGHRFLGERISWCGRYAWTETPCFGAEDGKLIILPHGPSLGLPCLEGITIEPINGVAFSGADVAISSRSEVVVGYRKGSNPFDLGRYPTQYPGGAHGIVASDHGGFVAPIGPDGVLILSPAETRSIRGAIIQDAQALFNCCKIARLGGGTAGEVFACAARRDGLLALVEPRSGPRLVVHRFEGRDVVDVCSPGIAEFPYAAIGVGRDLSLFFIADVLSDEPPVALAFGDLEGTAYSVLSSGGHVFLLTDREFITLPGLADRFLRRRDQMHEDVIVSTTRCDVVEAFAVGGDIFLIEGETVAEYPVAALADVSPSAKTSRDESDRVEISLDRRTASPSILGDPGWSLDLQRDVAISAA
ncbi:hypothetical protein [Paludisphaera rhizosphaerae]|uniref:hypothetical protein n=1 Tax=Paludisphaera rhizosphaerae TaxID=2711216 RepID=UPI0013E9DA1E|nr:hypothetical protein [Paludisphaera rhizosphaerae]